MKPISIQLYSLREEASKDFIGVIKKVADIGYKGIEPAGFYNYDPKEIASVINDLCLKVSSSHTALPTKENINELVDIHKTIGCNTLISGFGQDQFSTIDGCKKASELFNAASELLKPYGMRYGFHNHWWEFKKIGSKYVYDILLEESPEYFSELDVYWTKFGGADPIEIVSKYKSRLPFLHIKDGMLDKNDNTHTAVGAGKVNIPPIIKAADQNVLEWLIVEIDSCKTDMVKAVEDSYAYLTTNKLASGNK